MDFFDLITRYAPIVFAFVLGLSFLLLMMVFRRDASCAVRKEGRHGEGASHPIRYLHRTPPHRQQPMEQAGMVSTEAKDPNDSALA